MAQKYSAFHDEDHLELVQKEQMLGTMYMVAASGSNCSKTISLDLLQWRKNTQREQGEKGTTHINHEKDKAEPSDTSLFVDVDVRGNKTDGDHYQTERSKDLGRPVHSIVDRYLTVSSNS